MSAEAVGTRRGVQEAPTQITARQSVRQRIGHAIIHLVLLLITLASLMPLVYMISTSLKASGHELSFPIQWIPKPIMWSNYHTALTTVSALVFFRNTMTITILATAGALLSSSVVAFGFARARFPGRDALFVLVLSGLMLPYMVTLIPQFVLFRNLGWIDTLLPLIVPSFFGGHPFYIFLLRQFFKGMPSSLRMRR